jgi:hypothetical protein
MIKVTKPVCLPAAGRDALTIAPLARSAAPSPVFKDGVRKRGSGSTLSKPWLSGRGVEGLTFIPV